jgi:hypothetical protein
MKFFVFLLVTSAFAQEDLSKAFNKRKGLDCVKQLSDLRNRTRKSVGILEKIQKTEIRKNKDSAYSLIYLKLDDGSICSEQPSKTKLGTVFVQYSCRDKSGKVILDRSIDGGVSSCPGDAPELQ